MAVSVPRRRLGDPAARSSGRAACALARELRPCAAIGARDIPDLLLWEFASDDRRSGMQNYFVNQRPQTNGDHEVHTSSCQYLPTNRTLLGPFPNCTGAVAAARAHYRQVNGCHYCANACHTQ
jgi:hypothetical protein